MALSRVALSKLKRRRRKRPPLFVAGPAQGAALFAQRSARRHVGSAPTGASAAPRARCAAPGAWCGAPRVGGQAIAAADSGSCAASRAPSAAGVLAQLASVNAGTARVKARPPGGASVEASFPTGNPGPSSRTLEARLGELALLAGGWYATCMLASCPACILHPTHPPPQREPFQRCKHHTLQRSCAEYRRADHPADGFEGGGGALRAHR